MEMSYIKVHIDALEAFRRLSDAEFGRALRAVLQYVRDGSEEDLSGKDSIMFDVLRQQVERDLEDCERKSAINQENGSKGGRPRKDGNDRQKPNVFSENQKNRPVFQETEQNPSVILETEKNQEKREKRKEKETATAVKKDGGGGFLDDAAAEALSAEHQAVYDLAERAGFATDAMTLDKLTALVADFTAPLVLHAIQDANTQGKTSLAYLRGILERYRREGGPGDSKQPDKATDVEYLCDHLDDRQEYRRFEPDPGGALWLT